MIHQKENKISRKFATQLHPGLLLYPLRSDIPFIKQGATAANFLITSESSVVGALYIWCSINSRQASPKSRLIVAKQLTRSLCSIIK